MLRSYKKSSQPEERKTFVNRSSERHFFQRQFKGEKRQPSLVLWAAITLFSKCTWCRRRQDAIRIVRNQPQIPAVVMNANISKTSRFLSQWHQGDDRGLNELLEHHLPSIHKHVHKRLGPLLRKKAETNDYVQDVVVQFLRYAPKIAISDGRHFRALLVRIVENTLCDRYDRFTARRREMARERPLPSDTVLELDPPHKKDETPSTSLDRHEKEAWVRLGMEFLEEKDRELLVLRKWDNLSFSEIGQRLGISATAARLRHNRAVGRLGSRICALRSGNVGKIVND